MICPQCQTPNPDYAADCLECSHSLSGHPPTVVSGPVAGELTSVPTMGTPSSFKEWASHSQRGAASAVLPAGLEIGSRYRVKSLLGMGGMGAVYLVHDQGLDRDVALKLIRTDIAEDADVLARFKREIQLSSRVTHPNVLRVFDLGESEGVKFLTMQFVDGRDLSTILKKQGKLPTERLLRIFRQVAEGLKAAHDQGVIHRDLKPQNIMLEASDRVYVTDFGLAKSAEQSGMTQTGAVIGTPFYMSPEQVKGEQVGPQSDIYALGVILYQMLTGAVPFSGSTPYEVMMARILQPPRPVKELNPETPVYLQKIVERCLAVDRKLRYQSVDEILKDMDAEAFHSTLRYEALSRSWLKPAVAAAAVAAVLAGAGWWIYRSGRGARSAAAAAQKVQSVLIADFENKTGEPIFDGTLESSFGLAMEGASFVNTYNRGQARKIAVQLQPGATGLTEALGRLVAVREGVHVVTAGAIEKDGDGYNISVRAVDAATGKPIASQSLSAATKEEVLPTIAKLAGRVRQGMGDATPMSLQVAAAETFTAGSLEASHEYAEAQDDQYAGKYDDAAKHYLKAVELDPELGRADAGLGVIYSNQGRRDEAEKYYKLALAHIDRMSDREKYRTRGGYYLIVRRDPDKAIEEYGQLVQRYPADTAGIANLALAYFYKRDMARALSEGNKAIAIYPKNVPQRNNIGLYAMYAGDFTTAIQEQRKVLEMNPRFVLAYVGLALSQLGEGHAQEALATYQKAADVNERGASAAAMGLADVALYRGRPEEAIPILEKGVAADLAGKDPDSAAVKLVALAEAQLLRGDKASAAASADRATSSSKGENVLYPAARVYLETGREPKALALAKDLSERLEADPRAYAELIRGEAELKRGRPREAIPIFEAARKIADTWQGRLDLGRAYLEMSAFPEAHDQLETAFKRRGEATAMFLDESPTYRVFPPVYYYLGRAQEGIKSPGAAESFKAYLAIKENAAGDPLVADARRRFGSR